MATWPYFQHISLLMLPILLNTDVRSAWLFRSSKYFIINRDTIR